MSQEIVAGFEEQQVAHELSAQVVEAALQAVMERLEMSQEAHEEVQQVGTEAERKGVEHFESSLEGSLAISPLSSTDEDEEEEDQDQDELSGCQASQMNLRQLRLSALEDVLVCDRSRHKTNAARHLFNQLESQTVDSSGAKRAVSKASRRAAGSLGSRSSLGAQDTNSEDDNNSSGSNQTDFNYLNDLYDSSNQAEDCGTIKLDRRCCSSASTSSANFGRTLVCSVSPTGQFNLDNNFQRALNIHEDEHEQLGRDRAGQDLEYPINGDEIRQCRVAFRENRRLIEQAQEEACRKLREAIEGGADLSRSASQVTTASRNSDRSRWAESLGRRSKLPNCSRCQQKLYPIDKLDLDFARATLNIHRNCFKCQVCATLLRLDSYASIDTKLYCPTHVKCVAAGR